MSERLRRATRGRWLAGSLVAGGLLVIAGATSPWLTLYAGLYGYRGTTGLYGWLALGAGSLALMAGLMRIRFEPSWLTKASIALGGGLFAFVIWLLGGLISILRRPQAAMLVPRPGPGLFLLLAGAALILLGPVAELTVAKGRA
jgi:hypothetical protein